MATETLKPAERIQKTFEDLESETTLINTCTRQWKDISEHFASLFKALADRSEALESEIQTADSKTQETLDALNLRESLIPDRQAAASASIESKKEAAIKEMEEVEPEVPSTKAGLLRLYCRRMDSSNLWRFLISHRKDLALLRKEITDAISEAVDACRLVIDAVDDFLKTGVSVESGGDRCWAIGMLLRALFDSEGRKGPDVSDNIKERAAEVAAEWRKLISGKGEEGQGGGGELGGAEAQIFLQMVVAFGLRSRFDGEELRKLVLEYASRKEMAKLAAQLGFGDKMSEIIDELVKNGKELDAVYFAYEAGLSEKFSPASLLKSYLHNSRKKATVILKNGNHSAVATEESHNVESNAIRSIIKCVEYYKLEPQYSVDGLKKRLTSMDRSKAERKKSAAASKSHNKRARAAPGTSSSSFRPSKAARTASTAYAASYHNPSALHQLPPARHSHAYPIHGGAYDGSAAAAYGAAHTRSPSTLRQQYYMPNEIGGPRTASAHYGGPSTNYGAYDYAASHTAPAQSQYPL